MANLFIEVTNDKTIGATLVVDVNENFVEVDRFYGFTLSEFKDWFYSMEEPIELIVSCTKDKVNQVFSALGWERFVLDLPTLAFQ